MSLWFLFTFPWWWVMLRHVVAGPTTVGELAGGADPHLAGCVTWGACVLWTHWWMLLLCVCAQSCLTLCDPMHCSLPGSSVHGILQARTLQWVDIPFSRGSSRLRDWTLVSCIASRFFTVWGTRGRLSFLWTHSNKSRAYLCDFRLHRIDRGKRRLAMWFCLV